MHRYTPSIALSLLGISCFAILLVVLTIQMLRLRLWTYSLLILGCILEIIGYGFRYMSGHVDPYRITPFVIQYFCITVAPVFIAAAVYTYLLRVMAYALTHNLNTGLCDRFGRRSILWTFVTADIICTILQVTGAALIGNKTSKHEDPKNANFILLGGLAVQTFAFAVFLTLLGSLAITVGQNPECRAKSARNDTMFLDTRVLCAASILVMVRTVFRLIECAQGVFGYLSSHEVFFGVLEFAPIVVAVTLLAVWTPPVNFRSKSGGHEHLMFTKDSESGS